MHIQGIEIPRDPKYLDEFKLLAMENAQTYVPVHMRAGILRYIEDGQPVGSFLSAVLSNNLHNACALADFENARHLHSIVAWFVNFAPPACWGHDTAREWWIERARGEN